MLMLFFRHEAWSGMGVPPVFTMVICSGGINNFWFFENAGKYVVTIT
jgi:hypothetical protein